MTLSLSCREGPGLSEALPVWVPLLRLPSLCPHSRGSREKRAGAFRASCRWACSRRAPVPGAAAGRSLVRRLRWAPRRKSGASGLPRPAPAHPHPTWLEASRSVAAAEPRSSGPVGCRLVSALVLPPSRRHDQRQQGRGRASRGHRSLPEPRGRPSPGEELPCLPEGARGRDVSEGGRPCPSGSDSRRNRERSKVTALRWPALPAPARALPPGLC